jgi:hypothetical protein
MGLLVICYSVCRRARSYSNNESPVKLNRYERNLNVAGAVSLNGAENEDEPHVRGTKNRERKEDR